MIHQNDRGEQPIIYIMLNRVDSPSPTLPPTHFFSVNDPMPGLCPPIF